MGTDYITGLIVSGVFKKSPKTDNGALNSSVGLKGLCKKGVMLLFVLIAHWLDIVIEVSYVRDAVVIGFAVNELISVIENAGIMGVPMPTAIKNAIEVLRQKGGDNE